MANLIRLPSKRWIVKDKGEEWEFETHAEAQAKANELNVQKLKDMANE